jgi:hypothetical protein
MAQNTLSATPVNPAVQNWLASNGNSINATASRLGSSPTSIALAVSEEASHIVSVVQTSITDDFGRVVTVDVTTENFKDLVQDSTIGFYTDSYLTQNFFSRAADIVGSVNPPGNGLVQILNPTMMDVGWSNLNVGNSILTLQQYLVQTGVGGQYEGDPLNLRQYADNYGQFARDIANNGDVAFKIAGLNIAQLNNALERAYGDSYTSLPQDQGRKADVSS